MEFEGRATYVSLADPEDAVATPGVVVHRFESDLISSNANGFADSVREMLYESDPPATTVVLDCEQMGEIDMTGGAKRAELIEELRSQDVDVRLARIHGKAEDVADRMGVLDQVGDDHIHTGVADAVENGGYDRLTD